MLWVRISIRKKCTTSYDKTCQQLAIVRWFSPVSSINKNDRHNVTEILFIVALNSIKQFIIVKVMLKCIIHLGFDTNYMHVFMCMFCRSVFVLLCLFILIIVLFVLLRYTDSDYPFCIFKLFLNICVFQNGK